MLRKMLSLSAPWNTQHAALCASWDFMGRVDLRAINEKTNCRLGVPRDAKAESAFLWAGAVIK
jgi:hypothetical protein